MKTNSKYKILHWKNEITTDNHWLDESLGGVFNNILQNKFKELEHHIKKQGFIEDIENCLVWLKKYGKNIEGTGVDLACGTMWLTSYILSKYAKNISSFYAVDYSEKNIKNIGPITLEHYNIDPKNINLCLGSFYELDLPDSSVDFIVMAQAFHHAEYPDKLLGEMKRILKKYGFIIMVGELYIPIWRYLKCYLNFLISKIVSASRFSFIKKCGWLKKFHKTGLEIGFDNFYFPPDPKLGDYYHLKSSYKNFFRKNGFKFKEINASQSATISYILYL